MKIKKLLALLFIPLLISGCDINFELYDPTNPPNSSPSTPSTPSTGNGVVNVINPSNFQGTINYAPENQTLLTKEQVYQKNVTSTVYITCIQGNASILGSGVVFSEDDTYAYILTNAHVVNDGYSIEITYSNYKKSSASIVGYNTLEDIAVLSVAKNTNYTIATIQTTDKLSPGMDVVAIGSPVDTTYSFTATSGIISKVNSPIASHIDSTYELLMIQTDTTLNHGNSGGPLFDLYGNLIGINCMRLLFDNSGNSIDTMNFSIPADRAIFLAESFFQNKPYTRGKLGITIIDVIDLSLSNRVDYGVTLDYGLFVVDSGNDSFMENDIITKINGIEFTQKTQFQKELYNHYKNEPIEFTVYRNGTYITINSTLS